MSRLRLAFFSPFNPQKSGVSDYSEELLPYLAEHADVDIVAGDYELANPEITRNFRVLRAPEFLSRASNYDMAIYQIANSVYHHGYMIPCLKACPGIVVLHDYFLNYLMLGVTLMRGDAGSLVAILRRDHGDRAKALAWRMLFNRFDAYEVPATWPLIAASRGIITHSRYAMSLAAPHCGKRPTRVIPMGVPGLSVSTPRPELRERLGFGDDEFVLASVSTLSATKRVHLILDAVAAARARHPNVRLLLIGGGPLGNAARAAIERLGLADVVRHTGWISRQQYEEFLACADAVVDIRYPSGAETSASLLRALAAGKPLLVSAQGSFVELPGDCCFKIPVDETGAGALQRAIEQLAGDPALRDRMGEASLRHAEDRHRLDQAAAAYVEFIEQAMAAPAAAADDGWPQPEPVMMPAPICAALFRLSRLVHVYRTYGLRDTLSRLRREAELRRPATTGGAV